MNEPSIAAELRQLVAVLQAALPAPPPLTDWNALAFRWCRHAQGGYLESVFDLSPIRLVDLQNIDRQKAEIRRNTAQFVAGLPANNVLLTGARGSGKSSLVKALLNEFADAGLRVVEVDKDLLHELPEIIARLRGRPHKFIIYCDDLSFNEDDASYRALKVTLDGSLHAGAANVIVYATSNRRHLLPESMADNLRTTVDERGELHPGEAVEDKISLSDRFGLWLSFYANTQDDYLRAVTHWLAHYGFSLTDEARAEALRFAQTRGNRSGRAASQFARDWVGSQQLASGKID